jgi:hypothetical protein
MRNLNKALNTGLVIFGLIASSSAFADIRTGAAPQRSIDSCVSEIGLHADYSDAKRVRHELENSGHYSLAYKLEFTTKVYSELDGGLIRQYDSECVVYGDEKPVQFEIELTETKA